MTSAQISISPFYLGDQEKELQLPIESTSLSSIREKLLQRYNHNKSLYDEIDVNNCLTSDFAVQRFIDDKNGDLDEALEQLDATLKWRKEFGVNTRSDSDMPLEFYQAGGVFELNKDRDDNRVIYLRAKCNKRIPRLQIYFKHFIVSIVERVDRETDGSGYAIVLDLTGITMANIDMDLLNFLFTVVQNYYPGGWRYCLMYNMPIMFRPLWSVTKLLLHAKNRQLIKFPRGEEIKQFIDDQHLPHYLGGKCFADFTQPPVGCKSVAEIGHKYGFTDEEINYYLLLFQKNIIEAQKLICK